MLTTQFGDTDYSVAIIGAGSGIGRATAQYLGALGLRVACCDRFLPLAEETAASLPDGRAIALGLDVVEEQEVATGIGRIVDSFGHIDALVNCAGITGRTNVPGHEVDTDDFDTVCRINLRGAFLLSKHVLPHMLARKYGRMLHVASIAGKDGNAGMTAYSASKAGLIGLVKSLGKDYAESGITINALAPAVIRTPMVDALPQATIDYMTAKIPMRRCGELAECASLIAWTISPACSFTTGFTFDLSGGRATY